MYKILIADDEQWIRQGLKEIIAWKSCGIDTVLEADNGERALDIVRQMKPDVVITDIRMPGIDGIGLSSIIRQEYPDIKVIIISGYKDFNYAREAISLSVCDYILKPLDESKILLTVKRCISEIEKERKLLLEREIIKDQLQQSAVSVKHELISRIIKEESEDEKDTFRQLVKWGIDMEARSYLLFIVYIDDFNRQIKWKSPKEIEGQRQILTDRLEQTLSKEGKWAVVRGDASTLYGCLGVQEDFSPERLRQLMLEIRNELIQNLDFTITICVSNPCSSLKNWPNARRQAEQCMKPRFFLGKNQIIYFDSLQEKSGAYKYDVQNEKIIINFIKLGDKLELSVYLNEMKEEIRRHLFSLTERDVKSIYEIMVEYLSRELNNDSSLSVQKFKGDTAGLLDKIIEAETLDELSNAVQEQILDWCDRLEHLKSNPKRKIIREALNYTDKYYCQKITLASVAEYVYLNASYLSKLFCEETGETFTHYLMNVRIKKAKELLADPRLKIYEVGDLVGYNDVKYFVKIFKDLEGITPSEYRERCQDNKQK